MASVELGYSVNETGAITKDGKPFSTMEVPRQTAIYMDLYLKGEIRDKEPGKKFLRHDTLGFVNSAERGFIANVDKVDRLNLASDRDRARMLASALSFVKQATPDDASAFGYSMVVFYVMHHYAKYHSLPGGFSKRGLLAPPETTGEFLDRLHELREETTKIIQGWTLPGKELHKNPPLWRTGMFFQVAATLPLRAA